MIGYESLLTVALALRFIFAGCENNAIKFVRVSYNVKYDSLRIWYDTDIKKITPLSSEEIVLVCYYAPRGDWSKLYGKYECWDLTAKRIAIDIFNNALIYNRDFIVDFKYILPSWLVDEIESYF